LEGFQVIDRKVEMEWFFAFNQEATAWYKDMLKVAVISARENTKLIPICIYDGAPGDVTLWMERNGVQVVPQCVPFKDELFSPEVLSANAESFYDPHHASGAFLRLIAADIATNDQFLYTDCDVMFLDNEASNYATEKIGAVAEITGGFNSGVMLINKPFWLAHLEALKNYCRKNNWYSKYPSIIRSNFT
jgi:lipopolysaccharide biosynthesis glycosyltransferase